VWQLMMLERIQEVAIELCSQLGLGLVLWYWRAQTSRFVLTEWIKNLRGITWWWSGEEAAAQVLKYESVGFHTSGFPQVLGGNGGDFRWGPEYRHPPKLLRLWKLMFIAAWKSSGKGRSVGCCLQQIPFARRWVIPSGISGHNVQVES
jgi:hypothetical protein